MDMVFYMNMVYYFSEGNRACKQEKKDTSITRPSINRNVNPETDDARGTRCCFTDTQPPASGTHTDGPGGHNTKAVVIVLYTL